MNSAPINAYCDPYRPALYKSEILTTNDRSAILFIDILQTDRSRTSMRVLSLHTLRYPRGCYRLLLEVLYLWPTHLTPAPHRKLRGSVISSLACYCVSTNKAGQATKETIAITGQRSSSKFITCYQFSSLLFHPASSCNSRIFLPSH